MFWQSIIEGTSLLVHWEIWASILAYGLIFLLFFVGLGSVLVSYEEREGVQALGCLTQLIGGPLLQGVMVAFMVTALLPILVGESDFMPFSFFADNWWFICKIGVISILFTLATMFIPFIGDIIAKAPGTAIFIQGAIIFHMYANEVLVEVVNASGGDVDIFPGIWVAVGFMVFSIVLVMGFTFAIIFLLEHFNFVDKYTMETLGSLLGNSIGAIPGVLTLCIYCSYIRLTVLT